MATKVIKDKEGNIVNVGDTVTDFRGEDWVILHATPSDGHREGKIYAQRKDSEHKRECYASVFGLTVTLED